MKLGLFRLVSGFTGLSQLAAVAAGASSSSSSSSTSSALIASAISTTALPSTSTPASSARVAAVAPSSLDVDDTASILGVAKTLAEGAVSYYPGTAKSYVALPTPYYWWECGALMGAMLDYSHYTNDTSYDALLTTAISSQVVSPTYDLMVPADYGSEGNDDQAFWTFTVLSAAERNFPEAADPSLPSWLHVAENAWNTLSARWNTSACGGGLLWQIFADNSNGLNYRNSVSNGGLFQISARLYRATGNETYLAWANKVWDWSRAVEFIDDSYYVYDGADSRDNCTVAKRDNVTFSYSAGIYLYGAAVLANATSSSASSTWTTRTQGLLTAASNFFSPYTNATNVMYEHACETYGSCDTDMKSFKGYLSRFMAASAVMVPAIADTVAQYLDASAAAAGQACSGAGAGNNATCGEKWYVGAYDGNTGLGQEMSALETVQALLARGARAPLRLGEIEDVRMGASANASVIGSAGAANSSSATLTLISSTLSSSLSVSSTFISSVSSVSSASSVGSASSVSSASSTSSGSSVPSSTLAASATNTGAGGAAAATTITHSAIGATTSSIVVSSSTARHRLSGSDTLIAAGCTIAIMVLGLS